MLEDDEELAAVLAKALQGLSCATELVTNGVEGLRSVIASDYDAIVCDLVMPNLPGDMFYLAVERTRPHLCRRFVFMTGHKAERNLEEFARKVGCSVLWKPFELDAFLEAVRKVLRRVERERAGASGAREP